MKRSPCKKSPVLNCFIFPNLVILKHLSLEEPQNHIKKLLLCSPQKQTKLHPRFQTAIFLSKFTSWSLKLKTYMQEIKFASHKQYLFGRLVSIKSKEDSYRPKYTSSFFDLSESERFTNLQKQRLQMHFSPVCMLQTKLVITGRRYIF